MKKLCSLLFFMLSMSAFADYPVFPQVINYGSNVQVIVHNTSEQNVMCSGFVILTYQNYTNESHYYSEMVYKGQASYRMIYPYMFGMPVLFASNSIHCYETN